MLLYKYSTVLIMGFNYYDIKNKKKHGMIHMIIGPMFSGKTYVLKIQKFNSYL